MSQLAVGKDVLSHCGKCKLALSHIVVSLKSPTEVAKCKCNTCGAIHNYRDPSAPTRKRTTRARKKTPTLTIEQAWNQAMEAAKGEPLDYSIRAKFAEGDIIRHPSFGDGVVEKIVDNQKLQAIFQNDVKVLVHNR